MTLELFPTPSWPRPEFSIPFSVEHKRFPHDEEMTERKLTRMSDEGSESGVISSYWACDYENLYLAVDVSGSVDTSHERAWRYGDGMLLTVSHETGCKPVQSYTTLGIAGTNKKPQLVAVNRSGTWFPKLDVTKVKYRIQHNSDKTRISVTIPWSVLEPMRPLLYETIALNLTFMRRGQAYYQLIADENYDTEKTNLRRLLPVEITYGDISRPLAQSYLTRSCWQGENPVQLNLGLFNPKTCPARLDFSIKDAENNLETHSSTVELASGCHHWTLRWSPQRPIPTGEYTLELSGQGSGKTYKKQHTIFIINPQELSALENDLLKLEEDIKCLFPGAVHTALARLEWLAASLNTCAWEEPDLAGFSEARRILDGLRNGSNPLPDTPGLSRRAFRSQVDGSLQVYSLYLPKGFNLERKWPLLMMLHGSGVDEQGVAGNQELHKLADKLGLVLLFPKARTASGFYLHLDETDVMYNLSILKKRLPLDWDKLFLGGFSMGGFGTWHIGLRHPGHFAGLAVISGVPSLPFADQDFNLNYKFNPVDYAENAKKMPLLVVHGAKDCAVPLQPVREVVEALKDKDVDLTYKEHANGGHGDYDWHTDLASWLKALLKK